MERQLLEKDQLPTKEFHPPNRQSKSKQKIHPI